MNTLLLIAILLFGSCGYFEKKEPGKPENILTEVQFADVLADFAMAESASSINVKNQPVPKMDSVYAFNPLIERGVRKTQYDSTLAYYSAHMDEYKKVYEIVLAILQEMQNIRAARTTTSTSK